MDKLTKKQQGFVKDYIDTGNGTQSALNHYNIQGKNPEKIASVIGTQNLGKLSIQEAIESHAEKAESMIYNLSQNGEAETVRLNASKDIMDRAGYKAVDKSINLNIEAEITNPKARELAEKYEEELKKGL